MNQQQFSVLRENSPRNISGLSTLNQKYDRNFRSAKVSPRSGLALRIKTKVITSPQNEVKEMTASILKLNNSASRKLNFKVFRSDQPSHQAPQFERLVLENQNFTEIHVTNYPQQIKALSMPDNSISSLNKCNEYINLNYLDLKNNKIQEIKDINQLLSLQVLLLSFNRIEFLQNLPFQLMVLDLRGNSISKIQNLGQLKNLLVLNLSQNKIQILEGLQDLNTLQKLYLDQNQLSSLVNLQNLPSLELLSVRYNKIVKCSDQKRFKKAFPKLKVLLLQNNPLTTEICLDNYVRSLDSIVTIRCRSLESQTPKQINIISLQPNCELFKQKIIPRDTSYSRRLINSQIIKELLNKQQVQSYIANCQGIVTARQSEIIVGSDTRQSFTTNNRISSNVNVSQNLFQSTTQLSASNSASKSVQSLIKIKQIKDQWIKSRPNSAENSYIVYCSSLGKLTCYGNLEGIKNFMLKERHMIINTLECCYNNFEDFSNIGIYATFNNIRKLVVKNNEIQTLNQLKQIKYFPNLKEIEISNNPILNCTIWKAYLISQKKDLDVINSLKVTDDIQMKKKIFQQQNCFQRLQDQLQTQDTQEYILENYINSLLEQKPMYKTLEQKWESWLFALIKSAL